MNWTDICLCSVLERIKIGKWKVDRNLKFL